MKKLTFILLLFLTSCFQPPEKPESLYQEAESHPSEEFSENILGGGEEENESNDDGVESENEEREGEEETNPKNSCEPLGELVINEIYYDAVGSDTDGILFVELYGTPGLAIGGCQIVFINGSNGSTTDSIVLPETAVVRESGFYLIADDKTGHPTETNVANFDLIDSFDPQNGPDSIQLLSESGEVIDAVGYGEEMVAIAENGGQLFETQPALDVAGGHSLGRLESGLDTDNNRNDFVDLSELTPGF